MIRLLCFSILLWSAFSSAMADEINPVEKRWYSQQQVNMGAPLYAKYCAECHGVRAEATPYWRQQDAEGYFPPPPLNGTAHAWHHQLPLLRKTIREGGAQFGGKMPPFKDKLTAEEVDAIIAWFQSLWPDTVYATWRGFGKPMISQPPFLQQLPR